jgi:hypothetical protein
MNRRTKAMLLSEKELAKSVHVGGDGASWDLMSGKEVALRRSLL